jgi:hypothetical protein
MPLTDVERRRLSLGLRRMAKLVERELKRATERSDIGFSLVVWGAHGEDHLVQYVSNVDHEDAMRAMLALLKAWVEGMPDIPFHERQ